MDLHKQRYHRGLLFQSINCEDSTTRATTRFLNCINFVFVQQVTTTADNHKTQKYCWKRPFRNFNAEVTSWGTPLCPSHAHFVSQNQSLLYVPIFLFWSTIVYYARVTSITAERKRKENSNLLHYKTTKRTCILRWKALFERTEYSTIFRSNQRCIQLSWTSKVKAEFTQPTRW